MRRVVAARCWGGRKTLRGGVGVCSAGRFAWANGGAPMGVRGGRLWGVRSPLLLLLLLLLLHY